MYLPKDALLMTTPLEEGLPAYNVFIVKEPTPMNFEVEFLKSCTTSEEASLYIRGIKDSRLQT